MDAVRVDPIRLEWLGPYAPASVQTGELPLDALPTGGGLYLWTVNIEGVVYVIEVAQTMGLRSYLKNHVTDIRRGQEYVYDAAALKCGLVKTVHRSTHGGPALSGSELEAAAQQYLSVVRFFIAEVPDREAELGKTGSSGAYGRLLKRAEAAVATSIAEDAFATRIFCPTTGQHCPRKDDETPVIVYAVIHHPIAGLRSVIEV